MAQVALKEERAKWAVERRLAALQKLYGNLGRLEEAVEKLRVQQAWQHSKELKIKTPPPHVLPFEVAYDNWEKVLGEVISETLFNEEWIITAFDKAREPSFTWFVESDVEKSLAALNQHRADLAALRELIASKYRELFEERRRGLDVHG